jgi:deoxycytidylate deaminase
MLSEIIKGSPTSCCFLKPRKRIVTNLPNVVRGWADYCATTTEQPREVVIMSRRPAVTCLLHAEANALLMAAPDRKLTSC